MKTATTLANPWSFTTSSIPRIRNRAVFLNPTGFPAVLRLQVNKCRFPEDNSSLRSFRTARCLLMDVVVRSGVEPGHVPSDGSPGSWKLWILGMVISLVLPFWKSKWGPLLKLKNEVETVVEVAEHVTEIVEKVAEEVEKVADEVGDHLPEGRLKEVLEVVEDVAKETAKDAQLVEDFIEKVEDVEKRVEKEVETIIESEPRMNRQAAAEPENEPSG